MQAFVNAGSSSEYGLKAQMRRLEQQVAEFAARGARELTVDSEGIES